MIYEKKYSELDPSLLICILRIDENGLRSAIPVEESNRDYQEYLRWLENPEAALSTPNV